MKKMLICNKCDPCCKHESYSLTYKELVIVTRIYKELPKQLLINFAISQLFFWTLYLIFILPSNESTLVKILIPIIVSITQGIIITWHFSKNWKQIIKYWKKINN